VKKSRLRGHADTCSSKVSRNLEDFNEIKERKYQRKILESDINIH
jgi:hypothetical protein